MCQYLVVSQRTGRSSIVRSLRQLKRTTTNVKSLLIHSRNVSAVVEQLRFRYGRPEQLIRSQLSGIREVPPISERNLAKILPFATRVSNLTAFLQSAMADQNYGKSNTNGRPCGQAPYQQTATIIPFPTIVHFSAWLTEYANVVCTIADVEGKEPRRRLLHASIDHNEGYQQGCWAGLSCFWARKWTINIAVADVLPFSRANG